MTNKRLNKIQWDINPVAKRVLSIAQEGHIFTIKYVASRLKIPEYTARDYVRGLKDRLLLKVVNPSAPPNVAQQFQWCDAIEELDVVPDSLTARHLEVLKALAIRYRSGEVDTEAEALQWERTALEHSYKLLKDDAENMSRLLDCRDLWDKKTLVERLGFSGDSGD
jgi:hypothetical protein